MNRFIILALLFIAIPARAEDVATIINSGSTNIGGYQITVSPSGAVTGGTVSSISPALAGKFFTDLKALPDDNGLAHPCMKSASFGSRTTVTYHAKQLPDISCPGEPAQATLYRDALDIVGAAGASQRPRHVMRLQQQ